MSTLKVNLIQSTASGQKATLLAGTSCVKNPFAASTKTTQAHGLGATPDFVITYAECLTAELGYSIGDRITLIDSAAANGWEVTYDSVNVNILTNSAGLSLINKTTPAGSVAATAANWKIVAVPYILN